MRLSGRRVLVTGGAGFIGSHLVDRLIEESPARLAVVDNLFLGKEANLAPARARYPSLAFYRQDATDAEAMRRILASEGIDVVFGLAVVPLPTSLERPRWTVETNVALVTVLCELLREGRYQTLIHFSSSEAYGSAQYVPMDERHPFVPSTPYAASKAAGDQIVLSYQRTFGIDAAIVRPFNSFGPRQNEGTYAGVIPTVIRRALRGEPVVIHGDGEQTRDFIFVRDVADAAVRAYQVPASRGRVINIASGQERSVNRLVRSILEILGSDVPIVHGPPRPGDVRRHCGDNALAKELLGFEPGQAWSDGLRETVHWYREQLSREAAHA